MTRLARIFLTLSLFVFAYFPSVAAEGKPLNILFVTVDDMSCDSVGVYGCELKGTTPNMDKFASQGLRFEHAHVQVGNCLPSRNVMYSGRYPHNNGVEGFYQVKNPGWKHLSELLQAGGYFTSIRGKVSHSSPYIPFSWDLVLDDIGVGGKAHMKDALSYGLSTKQGIEAAKEEGKPFCVIINISDPHKPFYATGKRGETIPDKYVPSRIFTADEVPVPGFLPDYPEVREELAQYYSSVRRADDCLGAVMAALVQSGESENTVVMFLSDHGMPLPFAKTALYHHSTRTPWMVRWPGVTKPGSVDSEHMISAVDLTPTLLDIVGLPHPEGFDGRSFEPILRGKKQDGRDMVFKEYNENAGGNRNPMRSVQTKRFGYLYNPWANGERVFKTATTGTMTYRKMKAVVDENPTVAARVELFDHRVQEEFYDYANDPDGRNNLIGNPAYAKEIRKLRAELKKWMVRTSDHALEAFENRKDVAVAEAYVKRAEAESQARRAAKRKNKQNAPAKPAPRRNRNAKYISVELPEAFVAGQPVTFSVPHKIPAKLGEQLIHVTLKSGDGKRIERQVLKATGEGALNVTFASPGSAAGGSLVVSAFIGEEYRKNLQHVTEGPKPIK